MAEYKLDYTAEEINSHLSQAGGAVRYDIEQGLTATQRLTASYNSSIIPLRFYNLTSNINNSYVWFTPDYYSGEGSRCDYDIDAALKVEGGTLANKPCSALAQFSVNMRAFVQSLTPEAGLSHLINAVKMYQIIVGSGVTFTYSHKSLAFGIDIDERTGMPSISGQIAQMSNQRYPGTTHMISIKNTMSAVLSGTTYYNSTDECITFCGGQRGFADSTLSKANYYAEAKAVGDALATKITIPEIASVGQALIVTAVDENGHPTEFGVADLPVISK